MADASTYASVPLKRIALAAIFSFAPPFALVYALHDALRSHLRIAMIHVVSRWDPYFGSLGWWAVDISTLLLILAIGLLPLVTSIILFPMPYWWVLLDWYSDIRGRYAYVCGPVYVRQRRKPLEPHVASWALWSNDPPNSVLQQVEASAVKLAAGSYLSHRYGVKVQSCLALPKIMRRIGYRERPPKGFREHFLAWAGIWLLAWSAFMLGRPLAKGFVRKRGQWFRKVWELDVPSRDGAADGAR